MPAGQNQIARCWRFSNGTDDSIGGAQPSGTVIHPSLLVRISAVKPSMVLLEQGLETVKLFRTALSYVAKDVTENDIIEVYEPQESEYLGQQFRVIGVQHPSLRPNDPRSQVIVTMRRRESGHTQQY